MAPLYDVSQHGLLTADAKALGVSAFAEQNALAESMLGLVEPVLTEAADVATVERAVALQVNFQVESGVEAFVKASESAGSRSWSFRGAGGALTVHPLAARLVASVTGTGGWRGIRSVR